MAAREEQERTTGLPVSQPLAARSPLFSDGSLVPRIHRGRPALPVSRRPHPAPPGDAAPPAPRRRPRTFPALGAQVLADVVVHAHVLLQHVLPREGLPALLAGVALHPCMTSAPALQRLGPPSRVRCKGGNGEEARRDTAHGLHGTSTPAPRPREGPQEPPGPQGRGPRWGRKRWRGRRDRRGQRESARRRGGGGAARLPEQGAWGQALPAGRHDTPGPSRSRGSALPVWMSLCRSKFPMLLKMRPQISHGWMYLRGDASLRAGATAERLPRAPSSRRGRRKEATWRPPDTNTAASNTG